VQVTSKHAPIPRQRSRLWHTAASLGEVDSLQNAVDAFKVRHGCRTHALHCVTFTFRHPDGSPARLLYMAFCQVRSAQKNDVCTVFELSEAERDLRTTRQADDEIASGQHALETGSAGAAAKRTSPGSAGTPPPPQGFSRPRRAAGGMPRRGSMGNLNGVSSPEADPAPPVGAQLPPAGPSAPYQARADIAMPVSSS